MRAPAQHRSQLVAAKAGPAFAAPLWVPCSRDHEAGEERPKTHAMTALSIRTMRPEEIALAVDWAAAEGSNPGLGDAACFATVDPGGFLIGELDGAPAATISCLDYDARFAFLGFYIVRPDLRGRGHGLSIWNAAIAHAGARVIGLDGVVAQQENYRKSGFKLAYANVRYGGTVAAPPAPRADVVALSDIPFAAVEADDATVFPASRPAFLRAWIAAPGHIGRALVRDGRLAAWGVITAAAAARSARSSPTTARPPRPCSAPCWQPRAAARSS